MKSFLLGLILVGLGVAPIGVMGQIASAESASFKLDLRSPAYLAWISAWFSPMELDDPTLTGLYADPDHDGANNQFELLAKLNPRDARSRFRLQPLIDPVGTPLTLEFGPIHEGVGFLVYTSNDLSTWTLVQGGELTPFGSDWRFTIDTSTLQHRFFRIHLNSTPTTD